MDIFAVALVKTLKHEGVYSDNSNDHGGKTKWGITEIVARNYGYEGKMKNLPLSFANEVYRKDYWDINKLSKIAEYSEDIAIKLFDIGVNLGTSRAGAFLQRAINYMSRDQKLFQHLRVDGVVGTKTINTLNILKNTSITWQQIEESIMLKIINVLQGQKYIGICDHNSTQEHFIRGWFNRIT